MKHNISILTVAAAMFLFGQRHLRADTLPLEALKQNASATTTLGTFSLRGYSDRAHFPDVKEVFDARRVTRDNGEIGWEVAGNVAAVGVRSDGLQFQTTGRADWDTKYEIAPALVFTPKKAGTYSLSGKLILNGQEEKNPESVAFSIFRLIGADAAPVFEGRFARGQEIDLSAEARLRAIKVAPGESLVLTVWRPAWHWSAGGTLNGFSITQVEAPAR